VTFSALQPDGDTVVVVVGLARAIRLAPSSEIGARKSSTSPVVPSPAT
jgi:hypothetical protein